MKRVCAVVDERRKEKRVVEPVPGAYDGRWKRNKEATAPRAKNTPTKTTRAPVVPKATDVRVILMLSIKVQADRGKTRKRQKVTTYRDEASLAHGDRQIIFVRRLSRRQSKLGREDRQSMSITPIHALRFIQFFRAFRTLTCHPRHNWVTIQEAMRRDNDFMTSIIVIPNSVEKGLLLLTNSFDIAIN